MANLTISVDAETLKRARVRALREDTSVNAVLAATLEEYAEAVDPRERQRAATRRLLELSDRTHAGSGPDGRTWTRDDLYEERMARLDR